MSTDLTTIQEDTEPITPTTAVSLEASEQVETAPFQTATNQANDGTNTKPPGDDDTSSNNWTTITDVQTSDVQESSNSADIIGKAELPVTILVTSDDHSKEPLGSSVTLPSALKNVSTPISENQDAGPFTDARSLDIQAKIYFDQRKYDEAEPLYKKALDMRDTSGSDQQEVASSLLNLANLYYCQNKKEAESPYKRAIKIYETLGLKALTATAQHSLANFYYSKRNYGEAEKLYSQALEIRKILPSKPLDIAMSMNGLANAHYGQRKYKDAEPLYKEALKIRENALGLEHQSTVTSLNNLANLYYGQGKYDEAEQFYKQAMEVRKNVLGNDQLDTVYSLANLYYRRGEYEKAEPLRQLIAEKDDLSTATSLRNLANICYGQSNYDKAEPLYKQALKIRQELLPPKDSDIATSLNDLANVYHRRGEDGPAKLMYKEALVIRLEELNKQHPATVASLNIVAKLYYDLGEYEDAKSKYQEVLKIGKASGSDIVTPHNNLAKLYEKLGEYDAAKQQYIDAITILQNASPSNPLDILASLNNLAKFYYRRGDYHNAKRSYKQAMQAMEKSRELRLNHPAMYATSLNSLANLYCALGKTEKAKSLYRDAMAICDKLEPNHPVKATVLNNMASFYDFEEAESTYKQALSIRERTLGAEHPDTATSLNSLANLYYRWGKYDKAEEKYNRALAIREKRLTPNHLDTITSLSNLANLRYIQGNYEKAEELHKQALEVRRKAEHPDTVISLNGLASVYYCQGKYDEAEELYKEAVKIGEEKEHPSMLMVFEGLAGLYYRQEKFEESKFYKKQALEIRNKAGTANLPSSYNENKNISQELQNVKNQIAVLRAQNNPFKKRGTKTQQPTADNSSEVTRTPSQTNNDETSYWDNDEQQGMAQEKGKGKQKQSAELKYIKKEGKRAEIKREKEMNKPREPEATLQQLSEQSKGPEQSNNLQQMIDQYLPARMEWDNETLETEKLEKIDPLRANTVALNVGWDPNIPSDKHYASFLYEDLRKAIKSHLVVLVGSNETKLLAAHYCHDKTNLYHYYCWVDAKNWNSIIGGFDSRFNLGLHKKERDEDRVLEFIKRFSNWLTDKEKKEKCLIVFQGASLNDESIINAISTFEKKHCADIIVTTKDKADKHKLPEAKWVDCNDEGHLKRFVSEKDYRSFLEILKRAQFDIFDKNEEASTVKSDKFDGVKNRPKLFVVEVTEDQKKLGNWGGCDEIGGSMKNFMKETSLVFPTIVEQYTEVAIAILNRVCYIEIPEVQENSKNPENPKSATFRSTRTISQFPERYGRTTFSQELATPKLLSNPLLFLLFHMKMLHTKFDAKIKRRHEFCMVPLRRICTFESQYKSNFSFRSNSFFVPKSIFTEIVNKSRTTEIFALEFWDAVIAFKWHNYAASRFFLIWAVDNTFAVMFSVSANPLLFDGQSFPLWSIVLQCVTIFLACIFLLHEVRQMVYELLVEIKEADGPFSSKVLFKAWYSSAGSYFLDAYNYLDLVTYGLPLVICSRNIALGNVTADKSGTAIAVIFLWLHFLQNCRVFGPIGIFANVIIDGMREILPFLFIIVIMILGFGHGFWTLLANPEAVQFAENNTAIDKFTDFATAIKEIYWGWTGDGSALQTFDGQSWVADLLRAVLVFVMGIYLLNLLIAILNSNYERSVEQSIAAHRLQMARLIAEIEIFWMLPKERRKHEWFPDEIYFEISPDTKKKFEDNSKAESKDIVNFFRDYYTTMETTDYYPTMETTDYYTTMETTNPKQDTDEKSISETSAKSLEK